MPIIDFWTLTNCNNTFLITNLIDSPDLALYCTGAAFADLQENDNPRKRRRSSEIHTKGSKGRISMLSEDVGIMKWAAVGAGSSIGVQSGKISSLQEQQDLCYQLNEKIPVIIERLDQIDERLNGLVTEFHHTVDGDDVVMV
ncbi:hypothetical protein HDV02_006337 [Globomyces sp. JEL0801]|nr:hypothetical protein HDV02_006337 [Globomyces sp. JEL0801]